MCLISFRMSLNHCKFFIGILMVASLFVGCESTGSNPNNGTGVIDSGSPLPQDPGELDNYEIRPDDLLELVVQRQPEFSATRRVAPDGNMYIPILGQIKVAGKRPEIVESEIQQILLNGYLTQPEVTLIVVEKAKKRFVIIGQVKNAGYYSAPGEMEVTLIEAVAMAGGYTRIAGNVVVTRVVNGQEQKFEVNRKSNNEDASFIVFPGDMIEVEESIF